MSTSHIYIRVLYMAVAVHIYIWLYIMHIYGIEPAYSRREQLYTELF